MPTHKMSVVKTGEAITVLHTQATNTVDDKAMPNKHLYIEISAEGIEFERMKDDSKFQTLHSRPTSNLLLLLRAPL